MKEIDDKDIERLSRIYDHDNEDTFISVYINFDTDFEGFLRKREKACRYVLKGRTSLMDNFNKSMEWLRDVIGRCKDHKTLIAFISPKNTFFEVYTSGKKIENLLVVDTSPYIRPAVELMEGYEDIGLIVLDTHRAKIFLLHENKLIPRKRISRDVLRKHKKGGWSQARFQRIRKEEIKSFMKEVITYCEKIFSKIDKIVLAGPGNGKEIFLRMIPKNLEKKIVDVLDIDFDESEKELIDVIQELSEEKEREKEDILIKHIEKEILRDGFVAYGVEDVLEKSMRGAIDLVLVERNLKVAGWICEKCQAVGIGKRRRCPYCNNIASEVDVIEEIVEFCERFNSKVIFIEDKRLEEIGGIAALLRYK